ncbi:MAG TPA: hypothetical protein PLP70_02750 [bacterium]|jgi:hypothetical protein|nr:hypothetical protein [bacterium]HRS72977.1 hypothetical protein [Patescibacteria group bacterium]HOE81104.1 hypothetical protein [bacterium]HOR69477.1 hypothetical protein [bacterium]HOS99276.1 hypothetical protein [bacterium]
MPHIHINPADQRPMTPEEFALWKAQRRVQRQKNWSLAGLSTLTVAIMVMWFLQFKQNITAPLYRQLGLSSNKEIENILSGQTTASKQDQEDAALKAQDTDKDGLSDYDELNIYNTSPFLEDSDSDGVLDKVEIERGQDPNCPIGKDCTGSLLTNPSAAATSSPEASAAVSGLISQPTVTSSGDIGLGSLLPADATSLRQVLLESGMDQAMLNQFSDEELLEAYQEAFK